MYVYFCGIVQARQWNSQICVLYNRIGRGCHPENVYEIFEFDDRVNLKSCIFVSKKCYIFIVNGHDKKTALSPNFRNIIKKFTFSELDNNF